jgi:hypothetical protein
MRKRHSTNPLIVELVGQIGHKNSDRRAQYQDNQESAHGEKGYKTIPESLFLFGILFVHGILLLLNKTVQSVNDYSHYNCRSGLVKENLMVNEPYHSLIEFN